MLNLTGFKSFTLLFRAARDGFSVSKFHQKCNGQDNTVTIVKTTNDYIFGGYTSVSWDSSSSYKYDQNAFLFSLRRAGVSSNQRFNIISNYQNAIYCNQGYGPTFGAGHDFVVRDSTTTSFSGTSTPNTFYTSYNYHYSNNHYEFHSVFAGSSSFIAQELEVYKIELKNAP